MTHNRNPNTSCWICKKPIYRSPSYIKNTAEGKTFCSKTCFGLHCRIEIECKVCGKTMPSGQGKKTCSRACANTSRTGMKYKDNHSGFRKDKVKSRHALKKRLIEERGTCCEICGFDRTKILVPHHIVEKSKGGSDELTNLMLICPNCHMTVHHDKEALPCGVVTRLENGWV